SKQKRRSRSSRQQAESVAGAHDNESSSDSSLTPQSPVKSSETSKKKSKLNLKAIFAYHFRGKKFKAAAHRKYKCGSGGKKKKKKKYESTGMPKGRPRLTASPQERKRRLQDRGFQFPFVEKYYGTKHLPLKMVLEYEQAAIKGFLKYIEMLKYEDHLKKSLKALQASEDLEREGLIARKHKYLDDEGPISPIEETK
uniref:TATA box-binding protein-associated factor RNA polymerase I subunit D n=1 Tax=Strix occidentalis caurina TaxID=311401 RepID=A0A8D0FAE7_STROC